MNKGNNNNKTEYTLIDNFQQYIQQTDTFKKFEFKTGLDNKYQVVKYKNRLFQINAFSSSVQFLAVGCEDAITDIHYATGWGHQGLRRIITKQDEKIFKMCGELAEKIKADIIKEAKSIQRKEKRRLEKEQLKIDNIQATIIKNKK